ncbi:PRC-barrel domain-containing protein [Dactylosporangium sp. CA-092794]|uniref:PRC-barrel domain-containing protein n=1 Tax=Dactylosporangium sp. CA-092794 TaxID=3239929 RepID=UPI003D925007
MQPMTPFVPWAWRDPEGLTARYPDDRTVPGGMDDVAAERRADLDLSGYKVEATDGHIGSIDEASYEVGDAWLVVDTGPWIFGRKVLLPAGVVDHIDHAERKVYVDRTKDQIKDSPEYDQDTFRTTEYRDKVGDYYASGYERGI